MASPFSDPRPPEDHGLPSSSKAPGNLPTIHEIRTSAVERYAPFQRPWLKEAPRGRGTPGPSDGDASPLWVEEGLGVLCAEAQADGFPCDAPDTDCDDCEHALRPRGRHHA